MPTSRPYQRPQEFERLARFLSHLRTDIQHTHCLHPGDLTWQMFHMLSDYPPADIVRIWEVVSELARTVLRKPHLAAKITLKEVDHTVKSLLNVAEVISQITEEIPQVTPDPKDDYLIAYAIVGQADYLVTGDDKHLGSCPGTVLRWYTPTNSAVSGRPKKTMA